ncbi:MAG: tyrosine-type recombinase/integrase [Limisphaerales bacterium]
MKTKHLGDLLSDFLDYRRSLNQSPLTCRISRIIVNRFLAWMDHKFEVRTTEQLKAKHLEAWHRDLGRRNGHWGRPLQPVTINKNIESVRVFLGWLAKRQYLPLHLRERLEYVKVPDLLPKSVLNHDQVRTMLENVDTSTLAGRRDRTMLELLYSSGIRAAEILGLNLTDLDLPRRTAIVLGKGSKQRVVPLGLTATRQLDDYLLTVRPFLLPQGSAESAVFLDRTGRRFPYHSLNRMVARNAKVLKLPFAVTPHTFRRSCTTELIRAGANLYHVKDILGHATLETLKQYTRLNIGDLQKTHAACHPREREAL